MLWRQFPQNQIGEKVREIVRDTESDVLGEEICYQHTPGEKGPMHGPIFQEKNSTVPAFTYGFMSHCQSIIYYLVTL